MDILPLNVKFRFDLSSGVRKDIYFLGRGSDTGDFPDFEAISKAFYLHMLQFQIKLKNIPNKRCILWL